MKRREAEDRIADALTVLSLARLRLAAEMTDGLQGAGKAGGLRAMKMLWRSARRYLEGGQADAAVAVDAVAAVLAARGGKRRQARDEAHSLVALMEALTHRFPVEDQLVAAAGMAAQCAVSGDVEQPKRVRAAFEAWQILYQARLDSLPKGREFEALMAQGTMAVERERQRRLRERGVDDLQATFTRAWARCLEG